MINSFYKTNELEECGFKNIGKNVLISRFAHFYSPDKMSFGDNVRIDDFCILSGDIRLGSNIHISAHSMLYGSKGIIMENYSGLSPRTTVFSASDDFSGDYMIGPTISEEFTNVKGGPVIISRFCQIGAGSIILPNVTIGEGAVTGAMCLVNNNLEPWYVYTGIPAIKIKERKKNILELVKEYEQKYYGI